MADEDFVREVDLFVRRIGPAGAVNGLAQTILKLTVPGVPDFFQGTEFWDLSLVDPDNRRPVDFDARITALSRGEDLGSAAEDWRDGRIKQQVIARLLALRQSAPQLFARGEYCPLNTGGALQGRAVAFVRRLGEQAALVVVPRLPLSLLSRRDSITISPDVWQDTWVELEKTLIGRRLRNVLSGQMVETGGSRLALRSVMEGFPAIVLHAVESA